MDFCVNTSGRAKVIAGPFKNVQGTVQQIVDNDVFIAMDNKRGVFVIHALPKEHVRLSPSYNFHIGTRVCDRFGNKLIVHGINDQEPDCRHLYIQLKESMDTKVYFDGVVQDYVQIIEDYPPRITQEAITQLEGQTCGKKRKREEGEEKQVKRRRLKSKSVTTLLKSLLPSMLESMLPGLIRSALHKDQEIHEILRRVVNLNFAKALLEDVN